MAKDFGELKRNDIDGALELYRIIVANTKGRERERSDAVRALLMYQNDPTELIRRINAEAPTTQVSS